jgi:hypothetical protein
MNQQQVEWQKREASYKSLIRGLKDQLRCETPTVSVGLYRHAVEQASAVRVESASRQREIARLTKQLGKTEVKSRQTAGNAPASTVQGNASHPMSERVTRKETPKMDARTTPNLKSAALPHHALPNKEGSQTEGFKRATCKVSFDTADKVKPSPWTSHESDAKENGRPQSPSLKTPQQTRRQVLTPWSVTPQAPRAKDRTVMVRAAGGRKGLQERVKQMRSPKA